MLAPVHPHVLPEVHQLQAGADRVGLAHVLRIGGFEQVQHQPAHRIGRTGAVIGQGGVVFVAFDADVLLEGGQQVVEGCDGQLVAGDRGRQRLEDAGQFGRAGFRRRAGFGADAMQFGAEHGQLVQPFLVRGAAFIGDVVRGAGEPVDIGHGAAQPARQQQRGDGEVLVVIDGHKAGVRLRPEGALTDPF
ncbi:hypothetical protein D9M69_578330 [compost metagenome]